MSRLIIVKHSTVHGKGVFAAKDLPAGTELIEYTGHLITPKQADRTYPNEMETGHTFLFALNDEWIIDANVDGNDARWFNHSCAPNCIPYLYEDLTDHRKDRVFIETMRDVRKGEELTYDYGISFEVRHTPRLKKIWACRCGSPNCSGTMLKPKDHVRRLMHPSPAVARDLPEPAHFTFAPISAQYGPPMKRSFFLFATLLMALHSFSQDDPKSKAIIDQLIAKNKTYTSFDADFSSRLVNTDSKLDVKQEGNIKVKGRKFRLTLLDNLVINDGSVLWTYSKKTNEVSMNDPKDMDETLDPANLFNVYDKGFKSQYVGESTEDGVQVVTIKLFPLDPVKKTYHTIILTVDKNKIEPRRVEMHYKDGNVVTYVLKNFKPNSEMVDALFAFDKSKYPGLEVNDMR